jgi:ABC-2 type transport system ATP-binding protein
MNVAERLCDFIFMIFKGRKVLDGTLTSIQEAYGQDTIRIRTEKTNSLSLDNLPGVDYVTDRGPVKELRLRPETDPQDILMAVVNRTRVTRFEIAHPSLHDIFLRIAGPEAKEPSHA